MSLGTSAWSPGDKFSDARGRGAAHEVERRPVEIYAKEIPGGLKTQLELG